MKKVYLFLSLIITFFLSSCTGTTTTEINKVVTDNSTNYSTNINSAYEKASKSSVLVMSTLRSPSGGTANIRYSGVVLKDSDTNAYVMSYYDLGEVNQKVEVVYNKINAEGTIVSRDVKNGFVLIEVTSVPFSFEAVEFSTDTISKGNDAIVVSQTSESYANYLNKGYISFYDDSLVSTDAPTNRESLGAGIFDINGKLLGIICQEETGDLKVDESYYQGICYALRSNHVLTIFNQMLEIANIERPLMGITVIFVNKDLAIDLEEDYNLPDEDLHEVISDITEDSNGERAGFKIGDVLMTVNGRTLNDRSILTGIMRTSVAGSVLEFTVSRYNASTNSFSTVNITVTLNGTSNN